MQYKASTPRAHLPQGDFVPASSHQQRILTAILAVGLVGLALWQGDPFVLLVIMGVSALGQWEFTAMFRPGAEHTRMRLLGAVLGAAIPLAARFGPQQTLAWSLAGVFWLLAMRFLFRYSRDQERADFGDELILMAGTAYLPLMLQFFLRLGTLEIILVLLSTAASDTAAYYAGTLFGKRKIWPQISPKKSWAGSLGGMAGCAAAVAAFGMYFGQAPLLAWIALGAALNLAAQMGDFFESALKRKLAVKDSGTILPGHGGLLDRIDSLLFALPCYTMCRQAVIFFQ
jgi:phosphatidate cytidylyltransferase